MDTIYLPGDKPDDDELPDAVLRNLAALSGVRVSLSSDDEPTEEDYWDDASEFLPTPCRECGEQGACAYDSEGRPLIHSVPDTDDE